MKLLEKLIGISSPSGNEYRMRDYLLEYIEQASGNWKTKPIIHAEPELHDNLVLVFGKPRTLILAHMDTTGFTVRYQDQLVPIGGPDVETGYDLVGVDSKGPIQCKLQVDKEHQLFYDFPRAIDRGTSLTWEPDLKIEDNFIQGTYLDNRLGLYAALQVAEDLSDGIIAFSCYEEHGGGSVPMILEFLTKKFTIGQALISDITWVTEGVEHGKGVAISMRDRNIPRRKFIDRVLDLANQSGIDYQLEVEGGGSSDGREVHHSPFAIDWLFIGAAESNVHSPKERVHQEDLISMISMYKYLMKEL